jgi:DNA-binding MarR family transcriptional regulator
MSEQQKVSRQIVEIIPLFLRFLHSEMGSTVGGMGPSHFRLLGMLAHQPCNMSEIAEKQSVSMPTISNSVSLLVERGWILRTPASHDRRMVKIELTQAGRQILDDGQQHLEDRVSQRLTDLTPAELDKLTVGMEILRRVLDTPSLNERSCE